MGFRRLCRVLQLGTHFRCHGQKIGGAIVIDTGFYTAAITKVAALIAFQFLIPTGHSQFCSQMRAGGSACNGNPFRVQTIFISMSPHKANCRFHIINLRWEGRFAVQPVIHGHKGNPMI